MCSTVLPKETRRLENNHIILLVNYVKCSYFIFLIWLELSLIIIVNLEKIVANLSKICKTFPTILLTPPCAAFGGLLLLANIIMYSTEQEVRNLGKSFP